MRLSSVVVVGAGLAGAMAVTALRDQGFEGEVTLLGAEGLEPYDRPPLSKELLTRTSPAWLRDEVGADLSRARARLADPATALEVDDDGVTVTTATGTVRADAAVLATGAEAVRPPGWDAALTLHTAADADALRAAVRPGARLVVVGAGWIGAEVAGVAAGAGAHVTVVEAAAAPLETALGPTGALTAPWYDAAGVRLLVGTRVDAVRADGVQLDDGRTLEADAVLVAVGARPRTAWLGDALPVAPDGALVVDERYRVLRGDRALPHVVAVGDAARRRSARHGWVPGGHWDGALRGPAVAVRTLLAGPDVDAAGPPDDPAPYVFSTQLGHELALYGHPLPTDDVVVRHGDDGLTALWFRPGSDELAAVLAVDRPRDVAAARKLFTGRALPRLDRTAAADGTRPLKTLLRATT